MGRRSGKGTYSGGSYHGSPRTSSTMKFTLTEIQRATKNFSPALKIGRGMFGTVYRGTLDDGTLVAVKRAEKVRFCFDINLGSCRLIKVLIKEREIHLEFFFFGRDWMIPSWVSSSKARSRLWGV